MFTLISQVYHAFHNWDGVKHSIKMFETSNRLIKAFVFQGIDSVLNPSTIKQLYQYNRKAFDRMLESGFGFEYQGIDYTLTRKGANLFLAYVNPKPNAKNPNGGFTLTPTGVKAYKRIDNALNDVVDVANGLIDTLV